MPSVLTIKLPSLLSIIALSSFPLVLSAEPQNATPVVPASSSAQRQKSTETKLEKQKVMLGITVLKPSNGVYAQLPKLPRGSGFLLETVTPRGSADFAGLLPMDVIWKFGDQLLINENQLMTLLSLHQPGDQVVVSYFRAGSEKQTTLTLQGGDAPPQPGNIAMNQPFPGAPVGTLIPALPMRVISYEDRSASISDSNGTATLIFREGKPWLHVESSRGIETYNGPVTESADIARVPLAWRGRLPILQRSLEESIRLRRLPRVRRVPTPKHNIAGSE